MLLCRHFHSSRFSTNVRLDRRKSNRTLGLFPFPWQNIGMPTKKSRPPRGRRSTSTKKKTSVERKSVATKKRPAAKRKAGKKTTKKKASARAKRAPARKRTAKRKSVATKKTPGAKRKAGKKTTKKKASTRKPAKKKVRGRAVRSVERGPALMHKHSGRVGESTCGLPRNKLEKKWAKVTCPKCLDLKR